ncbi:family 16 glycosylhydrolase [Paeniroseomonas aquatica]
MQSVVEYGTPSFADNVHKRVSHGKVEYLAMVASIGSIATDAAGNTYKVVLADDFSAGYKASNWGYGYNGGTYWNGAFTWSSSDVNVRNGEMQVTDTRQADGSWTAGGFNSMQAGQSITYGTVEFDARVEAAQGTQAAILMWPVSDTWPRDGEIDILEAPKNQAMHSSHWEGADGSHQYSSIFSTIDPSKTHRYAMTWLPNEVTIKVDGQVVARWTDAAAIPDTAMGFGAMGYVAAQGEDWLGGAPDSTTPSVVTTYIDNVVMSQWTGTGGTPTPPRLRPRRWTRRRW